MIAESRDAPKTQRLLGEIVGAAVNSLRALAERKGLHLRCYFDAAPVSVMVDYRRLLRGLLNVVDNAIKHSDRGIILITATASAGDIADGHCRGHTITVSVTDTGPGLSAENQVALTQGLPVGDITDNSGEGIGIADFRRWLLSTGGTLSARNRERGKGAQFEFTVPTTLGRYTPPSFSALIDVMVLTTDDALCQAVAAALPADWYWGAAPSKVLIPTDLYFTPHGRDGAVQVLLVDADSGIGQAVLAGGAAKAPAGQRLHCANNSECHLRSRLGIERRQCSCHA